MYARIRGKSMENRLEELKSSGMSSTGSNEGLDRIQVKDFQQN